MKFKLELEVELRADSTELDKQEFIKFLEAENCRHLIVSNRGHRINVNHIGVKDVISSDIVSSDSGVL